MPTNMTMHQPRARIIRNKRQHQISVCGKHRDIATGRVDVVQRLVVVVDEGAGAGAEDVEVVAVQVDGVRDGRGDGRDGLDYPEGPLVGFWEGNDVGGGWEGGVVGVVEDCLEGGVGPLGDDARICEIAGFWRELEYLRGGVDVPLEEGLIQVVLDDGEADVEARSLRDGGVLGDVKFDVGNQLSIGVSAVSTCWGIVACGIRRDGIRCTSIAKYGDSIWILVAGAPCLGYNMKPIAVHCLVCVDDNIIPLSNADKKPFGGEWVNGNKVSGYDGEVMTVKANFEIVVGRSVDQAKAILFALCECIPMILASTVSIHVSAIDKYILCGGWTSRKDSSLNERCKFKRRTIVVVIDRHGPQVEVVI
jgi:hypothetical protein